MSQLLVVEGCTLTATVGTVSIVPGTSVLSNVTKCQGNRAYTTIGFVVSATGSTSGTIKGNLTKCKSTGLALVGLNATTTVVVQQGQSQVPSTVSISSPGQTKVRGV